MNYAALNTKTRAKNAKNAKQMRENNAESLDQAIASICRFIPDRKLCNFIRLLGQQETGISYYSNLWKCVNSLDKQNRVALRSVIGAEIDISNIIWIYRLKRYHRISGPRVYGYLVPVRYRLSTAATSRLADSVSPAALLEEIVKTPYSADISFQPDCKLTPEQQLSQAITRRYQAAARRHSNSLAPTLAYLYWLKSGL